VKTEHEVPSIVTANKNLPKHTAILKARRKHKTILIPNARLDSTKVSGKMPRVTIRYGRQAQRTGKWEETRWRRGAWGKGQARKGDTGRSKRKEKGGQDQASHWWAAAQHLSTSQHLVSVAFMYYSDRHLLSILHQCFSILVGSLQVGSQ
jgi:hypothetical protein